MAESLIVRKGGTPALITQYSHYRDVNFIGNRELTIDIGYARPAIAMVYGMNRYTGKIYGSNDNSNWTLLSSVTIGQNLDEDTHVSTESYRYLKGVCDGINNGGDNAMVFSVVYI